MSQAENCRKIDEICPPAIQNHISSLSMHISSLMKIHLSLLKLLSWNKNTGILRADNSLKNWRNVPISNPKPYIVNINAYTKFGENPLIFTSYRPKTKIWTCPGQITVKNWQNLAFSYTKWDLHNINAHTIWWKSTDIYSSECSETKIRMYRQMYGHIENQRDTIILSYNCVVGYKKCLI